MSGTFCEIETTGGTFRAWLTTPPRGSGPGIVLLPDMFGLDAGLRNLAARLAEEGYVCMVPDLFWRLEPGTALEEGQRAQAQALRARFDVDTGVDDVAATVSALRAQPSHQGGIGLVGFSLGGLLAVLAAARGGVDCAVAYYPSGLEQHLGQLAAVDCPLRVHLGDNDDKLPAAARKAITAACGSRARAQAHVYPGCAHAFANQHRTAYDKPAAMMAYSLTLAVLRGVMGPIYDLSALWDLHTAYEFETRNVDATMATMVDEPYVNHIPTMTGGVGHDHLKRFYKYHFVNSNPPDTRLIPVSRTIGTDRLVDEMIFCFTHTCEIPWMLPGVAPSGRYVEIPLVAIVNFRGEKLYHEHIYWDQASVLVQVGLLDPAGLPVAGIATAKKLVDETLPSNELMAAGWARSEGQPL
ncbi:MAG: dienelactone hydrolase family protein [Gammaproteobacteria bacterium]